MKQKLSFLREEEQKLNPYNSSPHHLNNTQIEFQGLSRGNFDTPMMMNKDKSFNDVKQSTVSSFQSKGLQLRKMEKSLNKHEREEQGAPPASP